jgi:hypothetical protein
MRNKFYFVAPASDQAAIAKTCTQSHTEWHSHTIPNSGNALFVLINPTASLESSFTEKYTAFPDFHDHTETLTAQHIGAFPDSCGLKLTDTAYTAAKKIAGSLGMAAMNPKA